MAAPSTSSVRLSRSAPSKLANTGDSWYQRRTFEVWEGRNRFFCDGRIMTGPWPQPAVATVLMIVIPILLGLIQTYVGWGCRGGHVSGKHSRLPPLFSDALL